ncbi:MAG: hypothetical protein V2I43_16370 [Parvularcula sp.]|jgi:hypothetical protein|nr:hypothetical protein [Parvularcula sp.]
MTATSDFDRLEDLVAEAIGHSRHVSKLVKNEVTGRLAHRDRTYPQQLLREIERGDLFGEQCLHELSQTIELVEVACEAETKRGWVGDEHHVEGGRVEAWRTADGEVLANVLSQLRELERQVGQVVDLIDAEFIVARLRKDRELP